MDAAFFGLHPRQDLARGKLAQLAAAPPQVLVIEGGLASERVAAALYYAAACNCLDTAPGACGRCEACRQIRDRVFMDLIFLDGREQSIKVDEVREVRQKVGEPPRGTGMRVVILTEAQGLTLPAANALLKSMEEPRPGNCFVLLAPQRERLLPTLVSRSWVLTLAWPQGGLSEDMGLEEGAVSPSEWLAILEQFWRTGQGLFSKSGAKGRLTRNMAQVLVLSLGRELADVLTGRSRSSLGNLLAQRLDLHGLRRLDLLLAAAQEALVGQVNPALTLEWLATRVSLWLR